MEELYCELAPNAYKLCNAIEEDLSIKVNYGYAGYEYLLFSDRHLYSVEKYLTEKFPNYHWSKSSIEGSKVVLELKSIQEVQEESYV